MQQSQPSIDYLAILRRRIHWLIWPALLVFLAAAAVALSLPNIYKSEAVIMIEGQQIAEKLVSSTVTTYADQRIQTIEREMLSRSKILDLVKKFDLYPDQRQKISTDALVEKVKESISITPLSAEVKTGRSDRPASITIAFILSFEGKSPRKVQAVVNDLAAFFLAKNLKARQASASGTTDFLQKQAEKEKQSISELDKKIAKFKEAHIEELPEFMQLNLQKVEKINEKMNNTDQQILALQEQSIMVKYKLAFVNPYSGADGRALSNEEKLQELELKYNEFKSKYSEKHPKVNALKKEIEILRSMVDQFQDLNQKRNRLKELEQNLAQLLSRYSDQHPVVRRIKAEIKELKKEIEAEENYGNNIGKTGQENIRNVTNPAYINLQSELDRINLRLASLENEKKALIEEEEQIYTKLRTMPDVEKRYKDLLMDRENVKQNLNELQRKLQVAMVAEGMEEGRLGENFTMTQPPFLPDEPYKPNRIAIMLLGLILGMGVSVGMAALKEYTDHSVRLPEEIERLSMHTVLAVIPNIPSPGERRKKIA
jgi:succinoglycan biosynthesis transport protein ExoP